MSTKEQKMKDIRLKIHSELYEVEASLFNDSNNIDEFFEGDEVSAEPEIMEINSMGTMTDDGERISISYEESEATGMMGSTTTVSFLKSAPHIITMARSGAVSATLVFEEGKRHHCVYNTPIMPFEVCVHTMKVENNLAAIDYSICTSCGLCAAVCPKKLISSPVDTPEEILKIVREHMKTTKAK